MRITVLVSTMLIVLATACGASSDGEEGGGGSGGSGSGGSGGSGSGSGGSGGSGSGGSGGGSGEDPCETAWALAVAVGLELGCTGPNQDDPCPNILMASQTMGCVPQHDAAYACIVPLTVAANMHCKPDTDTVGYLSLDACAAENDAFTGCLNR